MFRMSWGLTIDEAHRPFVVGNQQEEYTVAEEETQTHVPETGDTDQVTEKAMTQGLRRPTRQKTRPTYLNDYVMITDT